MAQQNRLRIARHAQAIGGERDVERAAERVVAAVTSLPVADEEEGEHGDGSGKLGNGMAELVESDAQERHRDAHQALTGDQPT